MRTASRAGWLVLLVLLAGCDVRGLFGDHFTAACTDHPGQQQCPPQDMAACAGHQDCGGPGRAQVCVQGVCVGPPPDICPPGSVFIPAGTFTLGNPDPLDPATDLDHPCPRPTTLTEPFCLDQDETAVKDLYPYLHDATQCPSHPEWGCPTKAELQAPDMSLCTYSDSAADERALNCITQLQAQGYCQHHGGDLPTEAEWEWAAGHDRPKLVYPWSTPANPQGPPPDCQHANAALRAGDMQCNSGALQPGQLAGGDTPAGLAWPGAPIHDLAGNLAEWVADTTTGNFRNPAERCLQQIDPLISTGDSSVARGGGYFSDKVELQTFFRTRFSIPLPGAGTQATPRVGFRCKRRITLH